MGWAGRGGTGVSLVLAMQAAGRLFEPRSPTSVFLFRFAIVVCGVLSTSCNVSRRQEGKDKQQNNVDAHVLSKFLARCVCACAGLCGVLASLVEKGEG